MLFLGTDPMGRTRSSVPLRVIGWIGFLALATPATAIASEPVLVAESEHSTGLDRGCVSMSAQRAEVEAMLGRRVFVKEAEADVVVRLDVGRTPRATITLWDTQERSLGRRVLVADSCAELSEALTLTLGLMLDFSVDEVETLRVQARESDPALPAEADEERVQSSETTEPGQADEPSQDDDPADRPANSSQELGEPDASDTSSGNEAPFTVSGDLELRAGLGFTPDASFGIGAALGFERANVYAELDATYWFESAVRRLGGAVDADFAELGAHLCPLRHHVGSADVFWCGAAHLGLARFEGTGFEVRERDSALYLRLGGGVRASQSLGPVFVEGRALGSTPIVGYRAVVGSDEGPREVFRVAPLVVVLGVGLGLRLP